MKLFLPALLAATLVGSIAAARSIDTAPLGQNFTLDYYASAPAGTKIPNILVAVEGYPRDANRTYDAAAKAAAHDGHDSDTLIVSPIFQVTADEVPKCHFKDTPDASATNPLWTCGDWEDGSAASNAPVTSFQAMDELLAVLTQRYPDVHKITIVGFSAGGQYVQHYIAFARPPADVAMRYVVGDPSEFVYFDPSRPGPDTASCQGYNDWKFGTDHLPANLGRSAAAARAAYVAADVNYLEAAGDSGTGKGVYYRLLEKTCEAELEGTYRLDRGQNYAAYDKAQLAHGAHPLTVVPDCKHSVDCVLPSPAAQAALFGK
jgi:hypothetical protein